MFKQPAMSDKLQFVAESLIHPSEADDKLKFVTESLIQGFRIELSV